MRTHEPEGTGRFHKKTLLVTTGSEAVENAVKIARAATKRSGAIAFSGAYHGRTHYTLSLTGKVHPYSAGMGLMRAMSTARFILARYTTSATTTPSPALSASLKMMPRRKISPPLLSRYRAKADFTPPLPRLCSDCALCDQHGIMLIADEVQSGAGRTGTLFAMEQMGVAADITTFAKSIAGGFPLAGVTGRADVMDAIAPGGLGGTYAGNPIACAAALAVLDIFEQENLLQKANTRQNAARWPDGDSGNAP